MKKIPNTIKALRQLIKSIESGSCIVDTIEVRNHMQEFSFTDGERIMEQMGSTVTINLSRSIPRKHRKKVVL